MRFLAHVVQATNRTFDTVDAFKSSFKVGAHKKYSQKKRRQETMLEKRDIKNLLSARRGNIWSNGSRRIPGRGTINLGSASVVMIHDGLVPF